MVKFYVELIKSGKMTITQVPLKWREAVRRALEKEVNVNG